MRLLLVAMLALFFAHTVAADEYTSASYKVIDPVLQPAGYASSTSFQLWSTLGEPGYGTSTSTSFGLGAGFLRFPTVTTPVAVLSGFNDQLTVSWSSAVGLLGFNVAGYDVGYRTSSTSPYTFATVGNVLSYVLQPVTLGAQYLVIVRALDSYGFPLATSTEVSGATVFQATGGGGVFGFTPGQQSSVIFSGTAYPGATVVALKDGTIHGTGIADAQGNFYFIATNMAGTYIAHVYATDSVGTQSSFVAIPIQSTTPFPVTVSRVLLPPTIRAPLTAAPGTTATVQGFAMPGSVVVVALTSPNGTTQTFTVPADSAGVYTMSIPPRTLSGTYRIYAFATSNTQVTTPSHTLTLVVGSTITPTPQTPTTPPTTVCKLRTAGDLNCDGRVNSTDFALLRSWYKKGGYPPLYDLTGDGSITTQDFALMSAYWTGN